MFSHLVRYDGITIADLPSRLLGGSLMVMVGVLYLLFDRSLLSTPSRDGQLMSDLAGMSKTIIGVQIGLIMLAMIVTRSSVASLAARRGLPLGNQVTGWLVLSKNTVHHNTSSNQLMRSSVLSLITPFLHSSYPNNHYLHRLVIIFLTFSPAFVILTLSYEGLFYFAFCTTLVTWVRLEHHIYNYFNPKGPTPPSSAVIKTKSVSQAVSDISTQLQSSNETVHGSQNQSNYRPLNLSDTRTALFFLYLVHSALFSVGNIASLAAFSLDSVYRLIPIFDPFSQGALLTFKILVPFTVISANLGILNRRLGVAPSSLFMVVMAITDVMTMNFFWLVRDEGSWLDIGTSISHFVIASLLCVFVAGLEFVSELFVGGVEVGSDHRRPESSMAEKTNGHANGTSKTPKGDSRVNPFANGNGADPIDGD